MSVVSADDLDTCTGTKTCDAAGACKKKTGEMCVASAECASGSCADGYCCNTACNNACDSCDLPTQPGTCGLSTAGALGSPSCAAYVCDGASVTCPSTCTSDDGCSASYYCAANGKCQARKAQGSTCNTAAGADCIGAGCRACATGYCADGYCCNTSCDTGCVACAATLQQPAAGVVLQNGTCGPVKDNTNPHNDACAMDPPSSCGASGMCNGAGGCRLYYPSGASCGASTCASSTVVTGHVCNGAGTCNASGMVNCAPFQCASATGSCTTTCAKDADCAADAWCSGTTCKKKSASGQACTAADQCTSGFCVDGYCCGSACAQQCEACNVSGAEGTCAPVSGKPHGTRAACATGDAQHACSTATCAGSDLSRDRCAGFVGSSVTCRTSSCDGNQSVSSAVCDGKGGCPAPSPVNCGAFACDSATGQCKSKCASDADCTAGGNCDGNGKCTSGSTCDGDGHTVVDSAGHKSSCAPYACSGGRCKTTCGSVDDCAAPSACDLDGHCVAPADGGAGGDSGGCAVVQHRDHRSSNTAFVTALVALMALARRTRLRARAVHRAHARPKDPRCVAIASDAAMAAAAGTRGPDSPANVGGPSLGARGRDWCPSMPAAPAVGARAPLRRPPTGSSRAPAADEQ